MQLHQSSYEHREAQTLTLDHARKDLENDKELFDFLEDQEIGRSFPPRSRNILNPNITNFLLCVLRDGSVKLDETDPWMDYCFRKGFVQAEENEIRSMVCVFPSPLHAR